MEIIAVFQDCVLCGVKGRKRIAEYAKNGIVIRKVGFTTEEGQELCAKAVRAGIGAMPFYVADNKFALTIDELVENKPETETKPIKTRKKVKKVKAKEKKNGVKEKGDENGAIPEI